MEFSLRKSITLALAFLISVPLPAANLSVVSISFDQKIEAPRKQGLTGYQFRAPGEWFAELYAAFKANILGPKHPARDWLKKL